MKYKALTVIILFTLIFACKSENEPGPVGPDSGDKYYLSLITPNGGENIPEGSVYKIKWSGNLASTMKIYYSTDNGNAWLTVADELGNSGNYEWSPVPNQPADLCRIKISSKDGRITDQSDSPFSIIGSRIQSISLSYPAGGEVFESGSNKEIRWVSSNIDSVKIEYSLDDGINWSLIGIDKTNRGSCFWNPVPDNPTLKGRIRVSDAKDAFPLAVNSSPFSIARSYINVLSPAGGETWITGESEAIKWNSAGVQNVSIKYSINAGAEWITIVESTPSDGEFLWENIPSQSSSICKIQIQDAADSFPSAISNNFFTIIKEAPRSIQVAYPNGGEIFYPGEQKEIRWNSERVDFVDIDFTSTGGISWLSIARRIINKGTYNWIVPENVSAHCGIRITDSDKNSVSDMNDTYFAIKAPKQIHVVYPNGEEVFTQGDSVTVFWTSTSVSLVKIQYSFLDSSGNRNWVDIADNLSNHFNARTVFSIPSATYKIRVSEAGNPAVFDESDLVFSVIKRSTTAGKTEKLK